MKIYQIYIILLSAIYIGWKLDSIMVMFNQPTLNKGVEYYAEVHISRWNSMIHTICMPITMFGMYLCVPAMLNMSVKQAHIMMQYVFLMYMVHYMKINFYIASIWLIIYGLTANLSAYVYEKRANNKKNIVFYGLFYAITALFIQETIGHYLGGDKPSRIEAIPNAIVYAQYYAISHFKF